MSHEGITKTQVRSPNELLRVGGVVAALVGVSRNGFWVRSSQDWLAAEFNLRPIIAADSSHGGIIKTQLRLPDPINYDLQRAAVDHSQDHGFRISTNRILNSALLFGVQDYLQEQKASVDEMLRDVAMKFADY